MMMMMMMMIIIIIIIIIIINEKIRVTLSQDAAGALYKILLHSRRFLIKKL